MSVRDRQSYPEATEDALASALSAGVRTLASDLAAYAQLRLLVLTYLDRSGYPVFEEAVSYVCYRNKRVYESVSFVACIEWALAQLR